MRQRWVPEIHWEEGLFLGPAHLDYLGQTWNATASHWAGELHDGVHRVEIDHERLRSDGVISLVELEVGLPDRSWFAAPGAGVLPPELPLDPDSTSVIVALAVPRLPRVGVYSERELERVYVIDDVELVDADGAPRTDPVPVRRRRARLVIQGNEDPSEWGVPLLRVTRAGSDDRVGFAVDPSFLPPSGACVPGQALWRRIRRFRSRIADDLRRVRGRIARTRAPSRSDAIDHLRLAASARALAQLDGLLAAPRTPARATVAPLEVWVAEVTALAGRELPEQPPFDPRHPHVRVDSLDIELDALLRDSAIESIPHVVLDRDDVLGGWRVRLPADWIDEARSLVLELRGDPGLGDSATDTASHVCVASPSELERIKGRNIPMIPLRPVEDPATWGLPPEEGRHWLWLDLQGVEAAAVRESGELAARCMGTLDRPVREVSLWRVCARKEAGV
ncbi:MAG: type VI secretion system baseplate subunit TssK [Planctomycetota bacterium]